MEQYLKRKKEAEEKKKEEQKQKDKENEKEQEKEKEHEKEIETLFEEEKPKNDIYSQLLKLSEFQQNNHSFQEFGPSFKVVLEINAIIPEEERQKNKQIDVSVNC